MLAVQIFDQKKFKKKDQGFLGVVNVRIGSVIDLEVGGDGEICILSEEEQLVTLSQRCSRVICANPTITSW